MRIVLLCLLLGFAPLGQADVAVARVNGVEISSMRLERYFAEYLGIKVDRSPAYAARACTSACATRPWTS